MYDLVKKIIVVALTWEARLVLWRYEPKIVAVTGSMGKTTTKDAIYSALADVVHVRKSEKSFNSDIGVPLAILGLENAWKNPFHWIQNLFVGLWVGIAPQRYPEWLILEVGADRPGDISRAAAWLRPTIAVITGVPEIPVHVEYFPSPEALAREKASIARHVRAGGKLVLNGDDSRMVSLCSDFRGMTVKYGFESGNDLQASHFEITYESEKPVGVNFRVGHHGSSIPVSVRGALGWPRAYAALAALAVGNIAGVDEVTIAQALQGWAPPPGRMRILSGLYGSVIIDDTYNSSPAAALSALDTLKEVRAKRRIAILGDMLELGKYSAEAHRNVGKRAADCADMLWTVGFRSRATGEAALDAEMPDASIREYEQTESERAGEELKAELREGDVILIKGSQSMRMERTVAAILSEPDRASELLVRQDEEWKRR